MYTVYILYSQKFHKHYTGFTSDLERRINEHNFLATSGYTLRFRPWTVLHTESFESKPQAMDREKFFKTGVGRELIKKNDCRKISGTITCSFIELNENPCGGGSPPRKQNHNKWRLETQSPFLIRFYVL